jgi:lambda family phage portal protein
MSKPRYRVGSDGSNPRPVVGDLDGAAGRPAPSSEFMRQNGHSPFMWSWNPALRDTRDDVRSGYLQAASRAIDEMQNSGWLAGAVEQAIRSTIGVGLRLAARPDAEALKWSPEAANKWARLVERRWEAWSSEPMECDAAGKATIGQMTATVMRSYFSHGEALALMPMKRNPGAVSRTKVKLLQPHKLTQFTDGFKTFQGVTMDNWGLPLSYRLRLKMEGIDAMLAEMDREVRARDGAGRRQVLHIFKGDADQVRGITPIAPALRVLRQYDQLSDATLQSALLRAIFAATIQSASPTTDVLQALQDEDEQRQGVGTGSLGGLLDAKAGWYENTKIDLGRAGKIAHLFPGESLTFHNSQAPDSSYEAFAKFLLREVARCLGMSFESVTGDYSNASYSSVRMSMSEIWPIIMDRRVNVAGRFLHQVYEAWLDEEIETGRIAFPGGFYAYIANRGAVTRADWRGPPKPQADDLKTAKAHETYKRLGVMTDEMICADLGQDWEDVYEQRKREKEAREKLDLPDGDAMEPEQDDPIVNGLINDQPPKKQEADA